MENVYQTGKIERKFYIQKKKDFARTFDIMKHMPSFAVYERGNETFTDYYYETEDKFLEEMGVTVRRRVLKDKQIISVKYDDKILDKQDSMYQQPVHEQEVPLNEEFLNKENLLFIEDKLNVIFGARLQIDILRKLNEMRVVYTVKTKRQTQEVVHNSGFKAFIYFDEVLYTNVAKEITYNDLILEVHMTSVGTQFNLTLLDFFVDELRKKMILVPMTDSTYIAAKLFTRFKK
ncbi:MAG: CYTH domain-containing protein [Spirochaetales bacterium]